MPDWKSVLTGGSPSGESTRSIRVSAIEELSQHLDDRYRSLLARGAPSVSTEDQQLTQVLHLCTARLALCSLRATQRRDADSGPGQ